MVDKDQYELFYSQEDLEDIVKSETNVSYWLGAISGIIGTLVIGFMFFMFVLL